MTNTFGSLVFTPVVKELQQRYGSRRQYERLAAQGTSYQGLGRDEWEFIAEPQALEAENARLRTQLAAKW